MLVHFRRKEIFKKGILNMNTRKQIIINSVVMRAAKAIYKGGIYQNASDSAFLRAVLEDAATKVKKAVSK